MALRYAILGYLAHKSSSGYDLTKQFERRFNYVWWASHGAIYTELQKLEREGHVRAGESGARRRQEYSVTDSGLAVLREWITEPAARKPRDEAILRVFQLWLLEPEDAAAYLDRVAAAHEERLKEYEEYERDAAFDPAQPATFFADVALRAGIANERAMGAWARESAADVRRLAPRFPQPLTDTGTP
ncbi:PadR family transcriptional regulator [Alloalcanivorax gelatiniphagus]